MINQTTHDSKKSQINSFGGTASDPKTGSQKTGSFPKGTNGESGCHYPSAFSFVASNTTSAHFNNPAQSTMDNKHFNDRNSDESSALQIAA